MAVLKGSRSKGIAPAAAERQFKDAGGWDQCNSDKRLSSVCEYGNRRGNDRMADGDKLGCRPAGDALHFLGEEILHYLRNLDLGTD